MRGLLLVLVSTFIGARALAMGLGDQSVVEIGGSYWPVTIVAELPDNRLVVRPDGKGEDADTIVKPEKLRRLGGGGGKLVVEWGGSWWPAEILQRQNGGRALIRYDGYGPEWDEMVPSDRMRRLH